MFQGTTAAATSSHESPTLDSEPDAKFQKLSTELAQVRKMLENAGSGGAKNKNGASGSSSTKSRSHLVFYSPTGKYLNIGNSYFDIEKLKADISQRNSTYPTTQLEMILGRGNIEQRKTLVPAEKRINEASKPPWAGFKPDPYELQDKPAGFGVPL